MVMARKNFAVMTEAGDVVDGATVEVRREVPGAPLAALKSDRGGATAMSNPFTAADGSDAGFYVEGGAYKIMATKGAFSRTWRNEPIGLLSERDNLPGTGVDAVGDFSDRHTYDSQAKGFVFLSENGNGTSIADAVCFVKKSATSGDWSDAVLIKGGDGADGAVGIQGQPGPSFAPNEVVPLIAGRATFDGTAKNFAVLVEADSTNSGLPTLYFKLSASSGDWSGGFTFEVGMTFLQAGIGIVTRTMQNKARESVSVLDFSGVDPAGITDSMAGIMRADAEAVAAGKALRFPGGNYLISGTLKPSTNARWVGELSGLTTFWMTSASATLFDVSNEGVELEHFRCVPSTPRAATAVTFAISGHQFYIHDVATAFNGNSFNFSKTAAFPAGPVGILDRVTATAAVPNAVDVDISSSFIVSILNSIFSGTQVDGSRSFAHFVIRNIQGQLQVLNTSMFAAQQGIVVLPGDDQVVTLVKMDTTYVDSNPAGSLVITPSGTGIVQRFNFVNGWLSGHNSNGLRIAGGGSTLIDQVDIHNTEFFGGTGANDGVVASGAKSVTLLNNRFGNLSGVAVELTNVDSADVAGNTMAGNIGVAISLLGTTDYADIHNNDLRGATTKLSYSASGANNSIKDNKGFKTANGGTLVLTFSGGVAVIPHRLAAAPTTCAVHTQALPAGYKARIVSVDATNINVALDDPANAAANGTATIVWSAQKLF